MTKGPILARLALGVVVVMCGALTGRSGAQTVAYCTQTAETSSWSTAISITGAQTFRHPDRPAPFASTPAPRRRSGAAVQKRKTRNAAGEEEFGQFRPHIEDG